MSGFIDRVHCRLTVLVKKYDDNNNNNLFALNKMILTQLPQPSSMPVEKGPNKTQKSKTMENDSL